MPRVRSGWRLVVLSALAVTGCTSSGTSSGGSPAEPLATGPASGTITWAASPIAGSGTTDARTVLISTFEKQYPDIHVTLVPAPTNTDTNQAGLATEISRGSAAPDVFMGGVTWPAQFGARQLALPLSDYLPQSYWKQFAPGLVQGTTYHGKVYGSPLFEDQGFLYYRKDLLAEEHMPVPKTWQQLASDARRLQRAGLVKYGFVFQGASYEGLTSDFMEYLTDAGGTAVNSAYTRATLDSPQAIKAVTFMRRLVTTGVTPRAITAFREQQAVNVFAAGQSAFLRNWSYAYSVATTPAISALTPKQVGVAPLPTFAGQSYPGYSGIDGWNMYVNPHSQHLAADLKFIEFLASPAAQNLLATQYSEIPVTTAVRDSATVKAQSPVLAVASRTKLVPRPAGTPNYPALSTAIYTNVNAALAGSASPSAAMASAQHQANTALTTTGGGL